MKGLARNTKPFQYCLYDKKTAITDANNNETGDYRVSYGLPVTCYGNISSAKGDVQLDVFGAGLDYDRVIVIGTANCPIDETTVLFVDKPYEVDKEGGLKYDYVVKKVARSLNYTSIAISRVTTR